MSDPTETVQITIQQLQDIVQEAYSEGRDDGEGDNIIDGYINYKNSEEYWERNRENILKLIK